MPEKFSVRNDIQQNVILYTHTFHATVELTSLEIKKNENKKQ